MPRLRDLCPCVCPLILLVLLPLSVYGQGATATLSGVVTDQTGAVVPGVNIAVISIAQGFQRTTTTNDEGIFIYGGVLQAHRFLRVIHLSTIDHAADAPADVTIRRAR